MMLNLSTKYLQASTLAAALALTACGGGGGGSGKNKAPEQPVAQPSQPSQPNQPSQPTPAATASKAQGTYIGFLGPRQSLLNGLHMIVLENNEFWGVYGYFSNTVLNGSGFIQGKGVSKNGRFSSTSGSDFFFSPPAPIKIEAEFIPGKSFKGNLQGLFYPVGTGDFNLSTHPDEYLPASNEIIQGSWKIIAGSRSMSKNQMVNEATAAGFDVNRLMRFMLVNGYIVNQGSLSVSASGTFSGTHQKCSYTGTISPRPTDKGVYNVSLNFAADGCNIPSRKATGIAVAKKAGSNQDIMNIMAVTKNPSSGIMLSFYRTKNE